VAAAWPSTNGPYINDFRIHPFFVFFEAFSAGLSAQRVALT
jgi:hypothetical protein